MYLVTVMEGPQVDIEDDDGNVIASLTIHEDEHGWMWVLRYADKRRQTRLGRL